MKQALAIFLAASIASAADLPVVRVVVYKNGVAYYERAGEVKAGEPARLDFKVAEMDDVLKSLVVAASGGTVARVRYELNESLQRKLQEQGITLSPSMPLVLLLDQWRGAQIEMKVRGEAVSGAIVSGRLAPLPQQGQRQELNILTAAGELRTIDLDSVTGLKLQDARLQQQFVNALGAIAQSRSNEKKVVFIDTTGAGKISAHYLVPAPIWKSSYRISLPETGEATLEGWAIIDNASGEDWKNVELTVVSGKPVSFVSRLYDPRYMSRPEATLPGEAPVVPMLYDPTMNRGDAKQEMAAAVGAVRPMRKSMERDALKDSPAVAFAAAAPPAPMMVSSLLPGAEGREAGELFEYRFSTAVNAKNGESLLLPFVQQKLPARKLLVYSDRSSLFPRNAVELSNSTGKTLDGGPVTVYQAGGYSGEALMETLKNGEKRMISYAVDQGTRVTTNFDSNSEAIRAVSARRGVITARSAVETTTTYTVDNQDAKEKTLIIEHPVDASQKLLKPKADETTPSKYRFSVKLAPHTTQKLAVVEEREMSNEVIVSSVTPDVLVMYARNKSISAAARQQLEAIVAKKSEIASAENEAKRTQDETNEINRDQDRLRQNINSLNHVQGQQEQVQRYADELAKGDAALAKLRDSQSQLRKRLASLQTELNALIEKLDF